jgi:hypothetical protein
MAESLRYPVPESRGEFRERDVVGAPEASSILDLLTHFLVGGLGLTLHSRTRMSGGAPRFSPAFDAFDVAPACACWQTDRGLVVICGACDEEQSRRLKAWALYLEWTLAPNMHHEGWWRCDGRRPGEWTKGRGAQTSPVSR